jgi:hypothetical protein
MNAIAIPAAGPASSHSQLAPCSWNRTSGVVSGRPHHQHRTDHRQDHHNEPDWPAAYQCEEREHHHDRERERHRRAPKARMAKAGLPRQIPETEPRQREQHTCATEERRHAVLRKREQ